MGDKQNYLSRNKHSKKSTCNVDHLKKEYERVIIVSPGVTIKNGMEQLCVMINLYLSENSSVYIFTI